MKTGNAGTLAALSPTGKELVIAVLNTTETDSPLVIDLDKFAGKIASVSNWRTSETEDCQSFQAVKVKGKKLDYTRPAKSLTTFVINLK